LREDLLYRNDTIQVEIPPLRERKEDIRLLAGFFLKKYAHKYGKSNLMLSHAAVRELEAYNWPGNVRELQHVIEKAVILSEGNELQPSDFYLKKRDDADTSLENITLEEAEKKLIGQSLKRNNGNMSAVASELGITRPTLYSKIKKFHL
jgi:DNA-binding NtrC family response regulator